jgi:hypothetical protein
MNASQQCLLIWIISYSRTACMWLEYLRVYDQSLNLACDSHTYEYKS